MHCILVYIIKTDEMHYHPRTEEEYSDANCIFCAETSSSYHLVLQRLDRGFVDIQFDCDFWFAGADVAVGAGRIQDTWDQQLLPEVGMFVQEDLEKR